MQTIARIPTNVKKWEVNETSETLEYTLGLLGPGDFFGHQELYTGDKRWTQAKSIGLRTEICFIKINLFLKFFSKFQDKKMLQEIHPDIDLTKIMEAVLHNKSLIRKNAKAILDAT
ncbi:unnamed protein product [Moneuplotes crassus]|uniref:Cyclic nucleotide-binding domain-containing protein n=1 Tax=Euplotes crassus TaxID=5936 RepID=A0AAD2D6V1_EUPCR|nr:unnamed protein product [Moneuplotes crassus]